MKHTRDSVLRSALLVFGLLLFPACVTDSNSKAATSWFIYSRVTNHSPATSPVHMYCRAYWKAVCDEQRRADSEYKQKQRFSGVIDYSRVGFRRGTVEVDYEISSKGEMTIKSVRTSAGLLEAQAAFAKHVMKDAANSLEPFLPELASVARGEILDTMVFEFQ